MHCHAKISALFQLFGCDSFLELKIIFVEMIFYRSLSLIYEKEFYDREIHFCFRLKEWYNKKSFFELWRCNSVDLPIKLKSPDFLIQVYHFWLFFSEKCIRSGVFLWSLSSFIWIDPQNCNKNVHMHFPILLCGKIGFIDLAILTTYKGA